MALTQVPIELSSTPGIVDNSNATAITIDSSENVLVGTTDTAPGAGDTNEGFAINSSRVFVSRASDYSLSLNRTTDDGAIAIFRKDGTSVGSIGTSGGDIYLSNGTKSLLLTGSLVLPRGGTGGISDGTVDLGNGSNRFKDIYLSGGAYLGGTAAANKLDYYEEGTWSPSIRRHDGTINATATIQYATFVKIGRLITAKAYFHSLSNGSSDGSSYWRINGLPAFGARYSGVQLAYNSTSAVGCYIGDAGGNIILVGSTAAPYSGVLSGNFMLNITYEAS